MLNREIYRTDPSERRLLNEGVANVNDDTSQQALNVLRYELETFVCDGQYAKGTQDILDTFLRNLDSAQQPGVWVSGFFGSGKSHLVKMLRALWVDVEFPDGATARGVAHLPQEIKDQFKELSTAGKRHGGLFAASGTLGSSSRDKSVRLALLSVILRAAGLPAQYPMARFVLWLKQEGVYEDVRSAVEAEGNDWEEELDNFYVAESLHQALVKAKPNTFSSTTACADTLLQLYPNVNDVSSDEMVKTIKEALTHDGRFPLTLVVLDEVQQYIGTDGQRSIDVQEAVEACCKNLGGKLMFIGTGQTAVTGTNNLKKLEGRFTLRIELSDADVDAVIRQVILAKKPDAKQPIKDVMENNLGEISRHLQETTIAHRQDDIAYFEQDYPILPVRRRFWEAGLRVLDQTGTASQLRNQLSMVHKAIQTNLDKPLGNVIPGDYLYFDSTEKLLQARVLPRKVHDKTREWSQGTEDERFLARACGLVFLINKVGSTDQELGIRATVDTVADLMVSDLKEGSSALRSKLPGLMDNCSLLMKVGEEYRIQTEESAAWDDEFQSQKSNLGNEAFRVDAERDDRIKKHFATHVKNRTLMQGDSKVARDIHPIFDARLPDDADEHIYVWVRDGWETDEQSVRADARHAGSESPTLFVFIPRRSADELREQLIDYKAASATLEKRGVPNTPEGKEARQAMETTKTSAEARIRELLDDAFSGARVFQAGGNEVLGNDLQQMILEGAENSLTRLYPKFDLADNPHWAKVYEKARTGAPDALKAVGDEGEPDKNPVCKAVLSYLGGGKSGAEIREHFEGKDFGWPRDAVNGAIQVLLIAGLIRAEDERGNTIEPRSLENKAIGKTRFKVEATTISTPQRIQIRKVLQKAGISVSQGNELAEIPHFLAKMEDLADNAGGEPPRPAKPDTELLENIRLSRGNEQLLVIYNNRDTLRELVDQWQAKAEKLREREGRWQTLVTLADQAETLHGADELLAQKRQIEEQRMLLEDPDPNRPLVDNLTQLLRDALNELDQEYKQEHEAGMTRLEADENWQALTPEQRNELLAEQRLTHAHYVEIRVGSTDEVLATLNQVRVDMLKERIAAMPGRFDAVARRAAELMEPKVQFVRLPKGTFRSEKDIDAWAEEAKRTLKEALQKGPVSIS